MKTLTTTITLIIFFIHANGQITFEKTYGGFKDEYSHSVRQTDDGGYILCGFTSTQSSGSKDVYVVKTDAYGNVEWDRTYGGPGADHGYCITKTNDGGYIICAESTSFGNRSAYLIRIDSTGDTLWTNHYPGNNYSLARCVLETDNGFIVCGSTGYTGVTEDVFLFKTDEYGNLQWSRTYGGLGNDWSYAMSHTSDGGYIICGGTNSFGANNSDIYIIKTNSSGDTTWTRSIGGIGYSAGYSVVQTTSGNFILGATTTVFGAVGYDILIVKLDGNGEIIWTSTIDYLANEHGGHISLTSDNCIIGSGRTSSPTMKSDIVVFKMDMNGEALWLNTYGGDEHEVSYGVLETSDLGFIITGYTTSYGAGAADMYLIKTDPDGLLTSVYEPELQVNDFMIYPNPCVNYFHLKGFEEITELEIIDFLGRSQPFRLSSSDKGGIMVDVSNMQKGSYVARITHSETTTNKIVIVY
jgi:hypothetical protein